MLCICSGKEEITLADCQRLNFKSISQYVSIKGLDIRLMMNLIPSNELVTILQNVVSKLSYWLYAVLCSENSNAAATYVAICLL